MRESTRLPSFCKLILSVGNFLNYVRVFFTHYFIFNKEQMCLKSAAEKQAEIIRDKYCYDVSHRVVLAAV